MAHKVDIIEFICYNLLYIKEKLWIIVGINQDCKN